MSLSEEKAAIGDNIGISVYLELYITCNNWCVMLLGPEIAHPRRVFVNAKGLQPHDIVTTRCPHQEQAGFWVYITRQQTIKQDVHN